MRTARLLLLVVAAAVMSGCAREGDAVMRAHELSLAILPEAAFAAWHGGTGGESAIYLQRLSAEGRPSGSPVRVNDSPGLAYEPDLIALDAALAVAWYQRDPETGRLSAWLAATGPAGHLQWLTPLGQGTAQARNPVVRRIGLWLHAAWIAEVDGTPPAVMHQRISLAGERQGKPRQIGEADRDTWNLNATVHGERLLISYDAALSGPSDEVRLLSVSEAEVVALQLTPDDGHASLYPDLQVDDAGRAALTWFDERDGNREVYLLVSPVEALGTPAMPQPRRITHSAGETIGAYVAWNEGTIGLAWSDEIGGKRDIYAQTFAADGAALGPPRNVSGSDARSSVPAIRAWGDGFLLAWNDYVAGESGGHGAVARSTAHFATLGR